MTSRSDWMLPGGSVFVSKQHKKPPGRSATQTMLDVEALTEFAPRACPVALPLLLGYLTGLHQCTPSCSAPSTGVA